MKKIITLIFLTLFLVSCWNINNEIKNENKKIIELKKEKISLKKDIEKIAPNIEQNTDNIVFENNTKNEQSKWSFFDKNIKFTKCDKLSKYENEAEFLKTDKNIKIISKLFFDRNPWYSKWVIEYCRNEDYSKYIWVVDDYWDLKFFQFDWISKKIKKAKFNWVFNKIYIDSNKDIVNRDYWNNALDKFHLDYLKNKAHLQGFWLKNKNIIPYSNYWVSITGSKEWAPWILSDKFQFFSDKTRKYCEWWLTPKWYLPVCFVDIFYEFDYIKNVVEEKKVCSYFINDRWIAQTLEKCFDINHEKRWYKLVWKTKWVDFYQDKTWNVSILDIDLNSAWIDFWWVDIEKNQDFYKFKRHFASEFNYDYKKYNAYFFVNWQFFDQNKNPTFLSFPLKSNWKIISDYLDNDISKRTFVIDNNWNAKILEWYKKEFLENKNYKELIVWFSPDVNANKNSKIWRTYIWIKSLKNVVFFIVKDKNQEEMNKIIADYWIKKDNIIMMDWWPSSQFSYFENNGPWSEWKQYYWWWGIPQFFIIYNK